MKEHIQCRLLTLEDLTLAKAYKTAQGMETAEQHASELQASTKPSGTEAVQIIQRSRHCKTSGFTTTLAVRGKQPQAPPRGLAVRSHAIAVVRQHTHPISTTRGTSIVIAAGS